MKDVINVSRRDFLRIGALAGGGLILGVRLPWLGGEASAAEAAAAGMFEPNAFLRIAPDGAVTVIVGHSEMGQGTFTSCAMLVAEELDADWKRVSVEAAPVDARYNHSAFGMQMTGGSTSTWSEWDRMRKAGAAARRMLIAAAAGTWGVDATSCATEAGHVTHAGSGKKAAYGDLVESAAKQEPPADVIVKDPKDFKIIGKSIPRLDTPAKVNGTAQFGLDVTLPGMLVSLVARSPVFGGKVKKFDDAKARAIPGVKYVVQIDRGVVVVADGFWSAKLGREALEVEWDEGALATLDTKTQGEEYARLATEKGAIARNDGNAAEALGKLTKKIEAVYDLPYLSHATMEPMNAVADVREDSCEVWTGTQFQTSDRAAAAEAAGLAPEKVKVHTTFLGGGFGRRAVPDCHMVREAVQVSRAVKAPVKVMWTREDDLQGGYYRPRALHTVKAAIGESGNLEAWEHHIVCQSFMRGTPFEAFMVKDGVDGTAVEGVQDSPYDIPHFHVAWNEAPGGVPTLWWRSVGHSHSAYVMETMMDELAHAAGKDPVAFRGELLAKKPRVKNVLDLAAEKAGWGTPLPEGRGRGIAIHESFKSIIAHVAEVSVSPAGVPRVHRFVTAIDCGPVVNPDIVAAQMESGVIFGLSAALFDEITFEKGRVVQRNFHDYPMLRMHQSPVVEVHIVPSTDTMGGVGEPGVPPVAPALANALFAVTGERVRKLPVRTVKAKGG